MRKILLVSAVVVIICTVISVTVSGMSPGAQPAEGQPEYSCESGKQSFVVKEYKGLVAVFKEGEQLPVKITQTKVESLPAYDAEKLSSGVTVEGEKELEKLLMDYCS